MLNSFVVNLADTMGLIPRWHGLRVVAADASDFMPAVRAYKPKLQPEPQPDSSAKPKRQKTAASASQHLFSLYLPGTELTLLAELHGMQVGERQMLFEALSHLLRPSKFWVNHPLNIPVSSRALRKTLPNFDWDKEPKE